MAEVVWKTLEMYGLLGQVIAFIMDNATNNDTMVEGIEARCKAIGIKFSAKHARLRCMPHTCHLAALKVRKSNVIMSYPNLNGLRHTAS
jgi:hypothetical protein